MRFVLPPLRHRHPLVRLLSAVIGLAVLGALLVFGLLTLAVFAVGGGIWLLVHQWRRAHATHAPRGPTVARDPDVLEGEFVVVRQGRHATH
jgi:hypothetical protein